MIASTPSNHPLGNVKKHIVGPAEALEMACHRLRTAGLRVTQPRIAILENLIRRNSPASIERIFDNLDDDSCDLVTVYRCLAVFEELGLVRRCFFHSGTSLYEINLSEPRHHHIVCKTCDKVENINLDFVEGVERMLREHGYAHVTSMVEFFGVCPACQKKLQANLPTVAVES